MNIAFILQYQYCFHFVIIILNQNNEVKIFQIYEFLKVKFDYKYLVQ